MSYHHGSYMVPLSIYTQTFSCIENTYGHESRKVKLFFFIKTILKHIVQLTSKFIDFLSTLSYSENNSVWHVWLRLVTLLTV